MSDVPEMVERVARAMCKCDPDALIYPPAVPKVVTHAEGRSPGVKVDPSRPVTAWTLHVEDARAAIAAMREPTPAMRKVCTFEGAEVDWPAMIDAALS